jgi:fatty-acid desaturase
LCFLYALAGPLRSLYDGYHRPRTNQQYVHLAKDISSDPILSWMSRPGPYFILVWTHTLGAFLLCWLLAGAEGVLLAYLCYIYVYNVGDGVDSFGHLFGPRNPAAKHRATNHWLLGLLAFGDGWHGNHHDAPYGARHGRGPWQFDLSYLTLKTLAAAGIVKDLKKS